jgi:hypothetical protein
MTDAGRALARRWFDAYEAALPESWGRRHWGQLSGAEQAAWIAVVQEVMRWNAEAAEDMAADLARLRGALALERSRAWRLP